MEQFLEAIPEIAMFEDFNNTTAYLDENGGVLFEMTFLGEDKYEVKFAEDIFEINDAVFKVIIDIAKDPKNFDENIDKINNKIAAN